jgi:hypothetical protein
MGDPLAQRGAAPRERLADYTLKWISAAKCVQ